MKCTFQCTCLAVRPRAATLMSVSLVKGTISHSECCSKLVFAIALPQVTAQLLVLESCYTVTITGTRCEFVTSNSSSSVPAEFGGQYWIESVCRDE